MPSKIKRKTSNMWLCNLCWFWLSRKQWWPRFPHLADFFEALGNIFSVWAELWGHLETFGQFYWNFGRFFVSKILSLCWSDATVIQIVLRHRSVELCLRRPIPKKSSSGFWLSGSQFSDFVKMDKVYQPDKREGVSAKINLRSYFEHYRDNREGEFVVVLSWLIL